MQCHPLVDKDYLGNDSSMYFNENFTFKALKAPTKLILGLQFPPVITLMRIFVQCLLKFWIMMRPSSADR